MSLITVKRSETEMPRPKRPIYWSALFVVFCGSAMSCWAMSTMEAVQALAVINPVLVLFGAMARGFFTGGGDEDENEPKESRNE